MDEEEIKTLHKGRKFLNKIKYNKDESYDWTEGSENLIQATSVLSKHQLTIK